MYEPDRTETRWQAFWVEQHTNEPDLDRAARPFFNLMMYPYLSGEGLHVGNLYAFTGADIFGRYQRLRGHDVFEPIGFDAFGIHSENYALQVGTHPMEQIPGNIANFERVLRRAGIMYDWAHTVDTTDPDYYRWTQWIFLERTGDRRALRALRHARGAAAPESVVLPHHAVRGAAAGESRLDRLVGDDQGRAAKLDRPFGWSASLVSAGAR
jgi:leucyl-tRNA synthetase